MTAPVPPAVSPVDLAPLEARLAEAVAIFASADQPAAAAAAVPGDRPARGFGRRRPARRAVAPPVGDRPSYRAQVLFNQGDAAEVQPALERLLEVDAGFALDASQVSPKLLDLYQKLRAKRVGDVGLVLDPQDATVLGRRPPGRRPGRPAARPARRPPRAGLPAGPATPSSAASWRSRPARCSPSRSPCRATAWCCASIPSRSRRRSSSTAPPTAKPPASPAAASSPKAARPTARKSSPPKW